MTPKIVQRKMVVRKSSALYRAIRGDVEWNRALVMRMPLHSFWRRTG
jgi:hypothetical protein